MNGREIILVCDYNGAFSSKWAAVPYRSGMDKALLTESARHHGLRLSFLSYTDIDFRNTDRYRDRYIFYSSSEDLDLHYKSYIEDIVYGLELVGARVIPGFKYLRAHHNKVFMEILRDLSDLNEIKNIRSAYFGTLEDFQAAPPDLGYPVVLKSAFGAAARNVALSTTFAEAVKTIKKLARSRNVNYELRDRIRRYRHKGYVMESTYRRKFIVQNFVPGLSRDWKILVFGGKYYVLERRVRDNDFRASGSGRISYTKDLPVGMLDFARTFYEDQNLPFLAMDVGFDGRELYLIEFQAIQFGTHTLDTAPYYFVESAGGAWTAVERPSVLEEEVIRSIGEYIAQISRGEASA